MVMSSFSNRIYNWFRGTPKVYIVNAEIRHGNSYAIHRTVSVEAWTKQEAYELAADKLRAEVTITGVGLKSLGRPQQPPNSWRPK